MSERDGDVKVGKRIGMGGGGGGGCDRMDTSLKETELLDVVM